MFARVTSKGQITIPGEVRKQLHLKKGSLVSFKVTNGHVELIPVQDDIMSLRGSVPVECVQDFDAIEIEVERSIAEDAI